MWKRCYLSVKYTLKEFGEVHKKTGLSKASRLLKCIAFVTLMAFTTTLFTPYSFAQSPYSKVPGGDSVSASVRQTLNGSIVIPPELGLIEESFHGTSGKTVLYIQDAHDSLEAQENIAKIINHLVTNDGVKTVFEEGYEGPVLTDKYFGFIKDPMIKEKVSYFLMDHLRVGGAEYAHINRTRGFNLLGADSIKLHKENVDQYRLSAEKKEAVTKDLKALEKELKSLVDGRFPRPLKEWLKTKRQFDTKKLDLFTYLGRTMLLLGRNGVEKGLGLIRFILEAIRSNDPVVIEKAKHIDAREVFGELTRLEQAVSETYLHDAADKQLFEYYKILSLLNRLNELQVSQEEYEAAKASLEAFDTDSFGRFIFSQTPKTLILSRMWERNIKDAVRFYEIAQERDHSLSQMLGGYSEGGNKNEELVHKPNVSVLVFGGFHKEAIKRILEAKGISYLVVSPHITKPSPRHEEFYKRLMADGHLSYELPVNLHTASRPWTQLEIWNGNQPLAKSELRIMASVAENMPNVDTPSLMLAMEQALKNSTPPTRSEVRETKSNGERTLTQPKSSISDDEKLSPAQEEEILRLGDQIKALKRQHLLHSVLYLATVPFALYFAYRGLRSLFSEFFNPTTLLLLIAYQLPITLPIFYGFFNLKLFKRLETTRTNKKNLEELRTYVPKDQNSRTLNDKKSSRSEVRGIQTLSDQGEKHAAIAEKLLGGHIQAVWGAAKTLGKTNTQGKTITLTPEVYRVIQPYLLPLPGHLSANGVAPEKIEEMERRENVDRKSKVIIDALFNLANIKDAEAEALLRKLFVPRSLLNDEAYTARIKFSIDKAMQGPMRNRIFNGFWHLREAAAMMIMDIEIYQRYEKLPSVSVSPIKKTFILAEFLCMRGVENWAETDMNSYQLRISSVLNAMTSLGIVARDGLGKFRVLEYASELYDRFAEDIANFLIKYPEDTVAILENVWHYPDIGLWYGVIDKLNQKGIRISKKLTDIDTALVVLSGASLIPISFNIPARPSRPYDIFYKITFGRLPPTSLVYRDSFPYGEDYPGPDHKALRWILAGMNNFLDDHPKNDLAAFLGVISKRKNENEITDQQLWDISEMLHNFAIKAYGLLSRYGPLHDQLKTVADVDQAKGLISGMLQQRNAFMLQGMAVKKRVVQYFYEEILKRNHLQPTWPSPLGLLEGMSDILNHYLWRCEYFFDRLEYEYALLNAKGDMTGTNNTHARSEVRSKISLLLAEAGVQKLSGKNQTEVAEIIDASQAGVSRYLDRHPEAYDTYKILRPVEKSDIEAGLAEAGVQKLSGKNQTEVAEIIGATQGGVSHYLDRHPAAYSVYQIRKLESGFARSEVRDFTPGRVELVNQKNWDLRALVLDWENTIQKSAQFFYDFQIPLFCNMIYGAQPTNSEKKAVADHIKAHHDPLPDLFQWAMQERVLHGKLIKTPPSWGGFLKTYEATAEQALIKAQPSWQKETPLIPGIESLLKELRGKLGLFVATSVLEQLKRKQAQMTGLAGYFENIFGAESEKFPSGQYSKMAILRKLMAEKKLTGRQIGIVEDSLDVLLQAQKMGVVTIGIVENAEKAKQFRRARVDIIIHGDYRNRQDFRKAISSRSEMRSSESYDARLAKTENKYRLALRSAIAEKLGVSQNHISIKNDLKGDSNLFGNPKSLVIKQDSTPLAYLRYVVSETDPSTGGREKTIEAYSFTEDSDLLPHMIAYVAFVHDSKQLHVSEANDDQLSAMDKIERLGFGSGHTWSAYHHHDMDLNMGALRTLLFPSLKKITIDPMPNEIDLPVKIGGQVHLVKRTDTDLQWPNFAYDVYWNGKRVIPLAMEEFKSKKKDYVLPNVVGNLNSDQLNLNIDVIDLGPITGNGIGSAIIKFLAGIASTLNLELHGTSTSNPGIMRLWGSVTDFTFNDAWVKAMLKSQLKKELAKEPVFDSDHARPDKAYTSFYFTTDTKGHAKFVFGNGDMLRSAQAYYFNSKSFSGSLYAVSLVLERDAPQTVKVDSLRVRDSKDAKKWLPSDLMRSGASLEEFNFNQDGTIDFQGKPFGRLVAFEDQVDVIGSPIPTRSEMRAKTPDEKGEENASAKSWIIPGKSKSESFYLAWGIRKYSSLLRRLLGNQFATLKISDAEAVKRELRNSVINEVIHEIGSFYFGLLSLGLFFKTVITLGAPWRQTVFSFTLSVIVGIASFLNLYPVMHGRYNRKRIYRILNRRSSEKKAQEKGVAQATLASKPRSEVRKSATVEPSQSNIRAPKPERKPVSIKLAVLNGVRSWMDAIPPGKMYIAISAETLARLGDEKQGGRSEARLWKEFLILKKIYAEKLKVVITGDVASKAGGRVKELENFGGKVFTGSAGLHLPKDAQVIYLTFEDRDEESLPAQLQPKIRASFHNLQEGDFLSAVQLSLSSYLDQDLRALPNIRQFIADQLSFNAAHELETLFSSWVIISAAA